MYPCYPPGRLIFNAFNLCPFDDVKVVIIGQDPYHEQGQDDVYKRQLLYRLEHRMAYQFIGAPAQSRQVIFYDQEIA